MRIIELISLILPAACLIVTVAAGIPAIRDLRRRLHKVGRHDGDRLTYVLGAEFMRPRDHRH